MKKYLKISLAALLLAVITASCIKDLDVTPLDKNKSTSDNVYDSPEAYLQGLAKLYASFAVSGQKGPSGDPDIAGIDEGFSNYLRQYWNAQELSTDEAVIAWNDATIKDFHWQTWSPNDVFIQAVYSRIFFTIAVSNEYIRATTGNSDANIQRYNAEARFIRAMAYWHALDLFGNPPFITEADLPGSFFPRQTTQEELFAYIESELKAIEGLLGAPRFEYGRADQAAAWTLLAKLYQNAPVYIGQDKNAEVITYCNKVIEAGYQLAPKYQNNFVADNHTSPEMIFSINFDGEYTRTYGGMVYLVHAAIGGSMDPAQFGVGGGWGGIRTTKALVQKFYPNVTSSGLYSSPKPRKLKADYPVIYVPGDYQEPTWDPANSTQLASVLSDGNYEGYIYVEAGKKFKFTDGPSWDVNYGDTDFDGTLEPGGSDIAPAETGYYKLNVNLNDFTYTMVKTDWGVIGDATAGGWDVDQNMTYDPATKTWNAMLDLTAAKIKFRANDGWDINYGDTGADGILEAGGADIVIPEAGTYVISMKLGTPDYTYTVVRNSFDKRAMFWSDGQSLEIVDIAQFTDGYAVTKFSNLNADGSEAVHPHPDFVCTDYPIFRLADIYLMYAEAVLRGGGGNAGTALDYVNQVRTRAYGDEFGNISSSELTLDFILDERARELYWEGHRRTDLIRYNRFTTADYLWPWKGRTPEGSATGSFRNLYPIPSADLGANPNLDQNLGY
ncbi:MAG: RagB/SusD family nutrient uptake outer membrane protein [Bacteroidales bacterium]|nr:RagB/SusD family nutrient uptake outer membrane protein [Bacteroidales bacterium]